MKIENIKSEIIKDKQSPIIINVYNKNYPSPIYQSVLKHRLDKEGKDEFYIELNILRQI